MRMWQKDINISNTLFVISVTNLLVGLRECIYLTVSLIHIFAF